MKNLTILILLTFVSGAIFSQSWNENFYSTNKSKGSSNFYEIQKDFNDYWASYDVKGGYYVKDGEKYKAGGWKQFKRWEWYWETRINSETGDFPKVNILKTQQNFLAKNKSKSDESNWQSMGPVSSKGGYAGVGRINCVAFHPTDNNTFWIGAPSGGLWKTIDGGNTWEVLTDNLPVIGVSEIIIPDDYETSKTIYIATGDRDGGDNYSIGVLKTTDDGATWQATGLTFDVSWRYRITRMLVHPTQQNIFYVATNGGIYKSTDSGANWDNVFDGLFFDLEFKPNCEDTVLYAASINNSEIFKTEDAGENWTSVHAFPTSAYRIELDVAQSDSTIVYALASTQSGGLEGVYKSSNSGISFTQVYDGTISGNNLLNWYANSSETRGQGWYDLTLSVSPVDENYLFLGGINSWKSSDGGVNWSMVNHWWGDGVPAVHADKHYMEYQDENTFFEANDGGIYKTTDGGDTWIDLTNGMVISQIYKLGVSQTVEDEVVTGLQDNGSKLISSGVWDDVKGGDGMECIIDYTDVNVQYATYTNGQIDRTTNHWVTKVDISQNILGEENENGAWVTPYVIDPLNNQTIYVGYEDVWKTTDRGDSWTKISDLSLSNKIRSMAIAPSDNKTIYLTDFDQFYITNNGGVSWTDLTSNLPVTDNSITYISVAAYNPSHVWITYGGYDNVKAYESLDGGDSWSDISAGLPEVPTNTIIENKLASTQQLYAGTDIGVFIKDGGSDWTLFSNNLPSVTVTELEIYYNETDPLNSVLYASTYGRGLWKSSLAFFELVSIQVSGVNGPFYVSNVNSAEISIPFNINETFTTNTFTAFLSDVTGDFSSEINIGNLVSDVAGTIDGVIPAGTVSGTGYKVKVKSSSPVDESPVSNDFEIILDNTAPTVVIGSDEGTISSSNPMPLTITFNEEMSKFAIEDITVGNGIASTLATTDSTIFNLEVTPTDDGSVTVDVSNDIATDLAGNDNLAADQFSILFDGTAPDANITTSESDTIHSNSFTIKIQFNEKVNDFTVDDIDVTNGSKSNFSVVETDSVWNTDISILGIGVVQVDIDAGSVTDEAGNENNDIQWSIVYTSSNKLLMEQLGVKIYPNPSNGRFTIEFKNNNEVNGIKIFDLTGKMVYNELFDDNYKEIDLSNLAKGVYILQMIVEDNELSTKLLIE